MKANIHAPDPLPLDATMWRPTGAHERDTGRSDNDQRSGSLRRRPITVAASIAATIAIVVTSCGGAQGESEPAAPTGSGSGADLYQSNCASCHGADLRGTDTGPSHLSIVYEPNHHGDDAFRSAIANGAQQHHWGFGNMAAISGLDDDEVDAIIAYIRSEQERLGFEP